MFQLQLYKDFVEEAAIHHQLYCTFPQVSQKKYYQKKWSRMGKHRKFSGCLFGFQKGKAMKERP